MLAVRSVRRFLVLQKMVYVRVLVHNHHQITIVGRWVVVGRKHEFTYNV